MQDNLKVEEICSKFLVDWSTGKRPQIANYLKSVAKEVQPALLDALVVLDVRLVKQSGGLPRASDYAALGEDAVCIAQNQLEMSLPSFAGQNSEMGKTQILPSLEFNTNGVETPTGLSGSKGQMVLEPFKIFAGKYRLLKRIAEGGMGDVWLAEQQEPMVRNVALKFIRAEIDSRESLARFEAERQAIAMMDHPNIAKIYDAGTAEDGTPYFVMEFVNGIPLNRYCDRKKLTIKQRLELMIPVCRAVQHAHQKGIIHRDLKHSNVLVFDNDGIAVPKVIDFGLAKALGHQQAFTNKTMYTEIGRVVGTIQYMSPEQADSSTLDIDTRTDVYSLGVMIYKLLTGATPIQNETETKISVFEALQKIRDNEPKAPSRWIDERKDTAEISKICELREIQRERLTVQLRGDLDWIVLKALAKDRNERYETANALALELQRYLGNERVLARPQSVAYSIKKFVARNRCIVVSVSGLTILLIAGIIATSSASLWALNEREIANSEKVKANIEAQKAKISASEARSEAEQANAARVAEQEQKQLARKARQTAETRYYATLMNMSWLEWQLGRAESAWQKVNLISESQSSWESRFLRTQLKSNETVLYGHALDLRTVAMSADSKYFATAGMDCCIKIWDARSRRLKYTLYSDEPVTSVSFSSDSDWFAYGDLGNYVTLCALQDGEERAKFGPFPRDIRSLAVSHDGKTIFAGESRKDTVFEGSARKELSSGDPTIHVIDVEKEEVRRSLAGHRDDITSLISGIDEQTTFVSSSMDGTIKVWRASEDGISVVQDVFANRSGVNCISLAPDGKRVASGGNYPDTTVRIWEIESGKLQSTFSGHSGSIYGVAFSSKGQLASVSVDRTAMVWDETGEVAQTFRGHFEAIAGVAFDSSRNDILTVSDDTTVRIWNVDDSRGTFEQRAHKNVTWCADITEDNSTVVSVSEDGTVAFTDAVSGKLIGTPIQHDVAALTCSISHDSSKVAIGFDAVTQKDQSKSSMIRIYDPLSQELLKEFKAHGGIIWDLEFSPQGNFLVSASEDRRVKVWDTSDWSLVKSFEAHEIEVASARFSHDGKWLVTAGDDKKVKLWDVENSFSLVDELKGHSNAIWRAIFSHDDKLIASCGYDGEIILWDAEKREMVGSPIEAHSDQIAGLTFNRDSSRLVSASDDGTIKFWDVEMGLELFVLRDREHSHIVHVSFSPDGSKLISGNSEGWLNIRTADTFAEEPKLLFLPRDATKIEINSQEILILPKSEQINYVVELEMAIKCVEHYPSYRGYTNRGMAEYRLGLFKEAVKSLEEAYRLEPIQYGEPDIPPYIEGFLAMSLLNIGDKESAIEMRKEFDKKRLTELMAEDPTVIHLANEVNKMFGD